MFILELNITIVGVMLIVSNLYDFKEAAIRNGLEFQDKNNYIRTRLLKYIY